MFIECYGLPSHDENFKLHQSMKKSFTEALDNVLIDFCVDQIHWTYHKQCPEQVTFTTTLYLVIATVLLYFGPLSALR